MNFRKLDEYIDSLPSVVGIPSAQIAVIKDGTEIYYRSVGLMRPDCDEPLRRDAMYNMWSCSKCCTTMAALQLLERGKFLLTDKVSDYLPEFADLKVFKTDENGNKTVVKATKPMLVVHLFTMTAGLNYDKDTPEIREVLAKYGDNASTADIVAAIAKHPLDFEPGEKWQYSLCHDVLARLVEKVSGKRFCDYVKENIFDPIGMKNSYYHYTDEIKARMAANYRYDDEKKLAVRLDDDCMYIFTNNFDSGGAGVISRLDDMILFAETMTHRGLAPNGNRILSSRTVDLWRSDMLNDVTRPYYNWPQVVGYGYGLGVRTLIDPARGGTLSNVGEFGWGGAAGSYVHADPKGGVSIVYMQSMLNNKEHIVHPRLRNIVYASLDD